MKKKLAIVAAAVLLAASISGCAATAGSSVEELSPETSSSEAASSTNSSEEESSASEESAASSEESSESAAANSTSSEKLQKLVDERADGCWTIDLINHIDAAQKAVITSKVSEQGVTIETVLAVDGKKSYLSMAMGGSPIVVVSDGQAQYTIDDDTKSYSKKVTTDSADKDSDVKTLGMSEVPKEMLSYGIENLDGTDYIYEEFDAGDGASKIRYYYDADCNIVACSQAQSGKTTIVYMTVNFDDVPASFFNVPTDYKEITEEEMANITLGKMMGAFAQVANQ